MSKYNFSSVIDRAGTSDCKTSEEMIKNLFDLNYYDDTISMWVADMDYSCPPLVLDALKERVDRLILGYTMESDAYYNSIIDWYKRRHQMVIKKEWLLYSNGTVTAIRNCLRAFTEAGDGIIIQPPVYYPFENQINETKRRVVRNNLLVDENNNNSIDFEGFEAQCRDPRNRMFIYCNPHNPVGTVWSREDTQRLLKICNDNDVLFFADEIHCDLIRENSLFTSALNLESNDKLIVATAVNKTFNVAGLHITNLVIRNENLRNTLIEYTGHISISPFALETTITAYNECEDWLVHLNRAIDENLNYMDAFIKKYLPEVKFNKPAGTYLAWLDFSAYGMTEGEILAVMADKAHIIVEGGSIFGGSGDGFVRMNVSCPKDVLMEALDRIRTVFGS